MIRNYWVGLLGILFMNLSASGQSSLTILGNPTINIQTAAERQNGATITQTTIDVTGNNGRTLTLQVRGSGDLKSGTNTILLNTVFLQVTSPAGLVGAEIAASTANQTLFSTKLTGTLTKQPLNIRYRLAPSAALFGPVGAYTTTLTFTISQL